MLRGREVFDQIKKSSDCGSVPPTIIKILVKLAENQSAMKQEIIQCAQMIDQMANILMANTQIMEKMKSATDTIRKMRGTFEEDDGKPTS